MAQSQPQETLQAPAAVGIGWRGFQLLGLVTAVSWLVSYFIFLDGYTALVVVFETSSMMWVVGGIAYFLSPIISLVLIGIAMWPGALAVLNRSDTRALLTRVIILLIPLFWLGTVFVGSSAMVDQMLTAPLGHSVALPVVGGAFFHVVFQHWFQGLAAIMLALAPERFETLTDSDQPAGTGAVVRDVTAQMELERRLAALHEATRSMMAADSPKEIATIAADAANDILDIPHSRVHLRDEETDELVPTAWTDDTESVLDGEPPTVDPESGLVWEAFQTGEANYYHNFDGRDGADASETALESSLLLPLGDHGIMLIQSTEPAAFTDAKLELAHILSANTQAALARTAREREMELVEALLDQSSDSVFVIAPETGQFLKVNDPTCDELGYTRDELRSMTVYDVVTDVAGNATVDVVLTEALDRGMLNLEGETQRKDGSTVPVHLTIKHIELDQAYLLGIARDITERKNQKQKLAAQHAELELLGLIQRLIDGIVRQVLSPTPRADIEQQVCKWLAESPFYVDAWLVDPGHSEQPIAPRGGTADGGKLRTVDDMPPETPATEAVEDTIETNDTHVCQSIPGAPALSELAEEGEEPAEQPADETAITLPLTYDEANYGALVVITDRADPYGSREQAALETLAVALAFAIHARTQAPMREDESTVERELHATESTAVISELAAELDCRVRLDGLVPKSDDTTIHYYVAKTDSAVDEIRERVQSLDSVEDCRIIEHNDECFFEVRMRSSDVLDRIVDAGAVVRTAQAGPGNARIVLDIHSSEDPEKITAILQAHDVNSNWAVTANRQVDRPMGRMQAACKTLEKSLTGKQREALLTAYFAGYYDYPRKSTAQEVANTLTITDSTLFQHLQAAQRKLIEAWIKSPGETETAGPKTM